VSATPIARVFAALKRFDVGFSLYTKQILAFVVITLLAVGSVGGFIVRSYSDQLFTSQGQNLFSKAQNRAHIIEDLIEQQVATLTTVTLNDSLQGYTDRSIFFYRTSDLGLIQAVIADRDAIWRDLSRDDPVVSTVLRNVVATSLAQYQAQNPDIIALRVIDKYGGLVASTDRRGVFNYQTNALWQQVIRGQTVISNPTLSSDTDEGQIAIGVPILIESQPEPIGVLYATYRLSAVLAGLDFSAEMQNSYAQLLLDDQTVLAADGAILDIDAATQAVVQQAQIYQYSTVAYQGRERLVSIVPLDESEDLQKLNWRLFVSLDIEEAMAPVRTTVGNALLTIVGITLLAILAAVVLARLVTAPIIQMTNAARAMAKGDFQQRLTLTSRDEVGDLAQSFNAMAAALEERIRSEQQAQAEQLQLQEQMLQFQEERIRELTVPLIPLNNQILLLPVIGSLDQRRAQDLMHQLLQEVAAKRAHTVIIDLTGLRSINTFVAEVLVQAAQGVQLLGAKAVLIGVKPQAAQILVDCNLNLKQLIVQRDLQSVLTQLLISENPQTAHYR
jgi:anti-anti-sigma factor